MRTSDHADVLVLDATSRAALVSVRSLGRAGLRVAVAECASRPTAPAFRSRWASSCHALPDFWGDPSAFVDGVLGVVRRTGARLVVPAHDGSVAALRARRADVEALTVLALPGEPALGVFSDKTATLELAVRLGLRVPRAEAVLTRAGTARAAARIGLPAVVKPAESWSPQDHVGADRLVCRDVVDLRELQEAVDALLDAGACALVQELVPGVREAVHLVAQDGVVVAASSQQTLRTYPPLGGSSVLRQSTAMPDDLRAAASALVAATGCTGYAEVEFRRDAAGEPVLMEVNPRLSASVEVAVLAGLDVPLLLWQQARRQGVTGPVGTDALVRVRWLGGDVRWLVRTAHEQGRPQRLTRARAIGTFAAEFLRPSSWDYLGWRDPAPALVALRGFVRETGTRTVKGSAVRVPADR